MHCNWRPVDHVAKLFFTSQVGKMSLSRATGRYKHETGRGVSKMLQVVPLHS